MYESYIVDELGYAKYRCGELTDQEIMDILAEHPEWRRECIYINPEAIFWLDKVIILCYNVTTEVRKWAQQ